MSENFNGKDYSEYFKILEQKLDTSKPSVPVKRESAAVSPSVKKRVKKGTYRVFRIRPAAIICTFAVAALIAALIAVPAIKSRGENKKSDEIKKSTNSAIITAEEPESNQIVYNFTDSTAPVPAENDAEAAIVINTETHDIVAAKNEHERLYPASTTKIMTLIVACDNIKNYSDTFTMTLDITDPLFIEGASVAGFLNQEEISMTDLLYGMILPSGADAAMGLAVKIAGSEKAFREGKAERSRCGNDQGKAHAAARACRIHKDAGRNLQCSVRPGIGCAQKAQGCRVCAKGFGHITGDSGKANQLQ